MRSLMSEDLVDVRVQDRLRRDLAIKLGQAVIDAIEGGLNPDHAKNALEEILQGELRCEQTRRAFARTYA